MLPVKEYIVDVWGKARFYGENISVSQSQSQTSSGELGDVGNGGRLRCVSMVRQTPPFHVCAFMYC